MKRVALFTVFVLLATACLSYAQPSITSRSSGLQTASAVIAAKPARLVDLSVYTAAAEVTVTCYDNASAASGTIIAKAVVPALVKGGGDSKPVPVPAVKGIYCSMSGAGGTYIVYYDPQ
jgi:hypothetical protein